MSKAYLLVICLLAAAFTGCLADDTSTEKIEPVSSGDNGDSPNNNTTMMSNMTIRFAEQHQANISKIGNTVQVTFTSGQYSNFIWFIDYNGNEIRHNIVDYSFDNCYSNGNWSARDSNGTEACFEQLDDDVIWEFNLAREPMSVGLGQTHMYYLESFP